MIVAGGCYFLGGFGRLFSDKLDVIDGIPKGGYDSIIPIMISRLPEILIGIVVILVLSASMSTLSSLVLASSSTLALDFINGTVVKEMNEKALVRVMRIFIVVFIAISAAIAIIQYNSSVTFIADLMGISWGALAGSFLAPFLYGLYWRKTTKAACWVSFVFGSGIMILNMLARSSFPLFLQSPINCGVIAMLGGLVIVPAVSLFTKKPVFKEDIFACYEKSVTVHAKDSLGN